MTHVNDQQNTEPVTYGLADVLVAGAGCLVPAVVVTVVSGLLGGTGFLAVPVGAAGALATLQRWREVRTGKATAGQLDKVDRNYWQWAVSGLVAAVVMPAFFPENAYANSHWMVYLNAALLGVCLLAVPMLKLHARLLKARIKSRIGGGRDAA